MAVGLNGKTGDFLSCAEFSVCQLTDEFVSLLKSTFIQFSQFVTDDGVLLHYQWEMRNQSGT